MVLCYRLNYGCFSKWKPEWIELSPGSRCIVELICQHISRVIRFKWGHQVINRATSLLISYKLVLRPHSRTGSLERETETDKDKLWYIYKNPA